MTTPVPAIYSAMAAVMDAVKGVAKRDRNTQQGFNFRGVDAVVNAVGPILREHGVIGPVPHSIEEIREERYETAKKAQMHGVMLRIKWRFYSGEDGSYLEAETLGESADSGDKAASKSHSVGYRTVILETFCIPTDEKDSDASAHERVIGDGQPESAGELSVSAGEWREKIAEAADPATLTEIGKDLASSPLSAAARKPLKEQWTARMQALKAATP